MAASATNCASALDALHCALCARTSERHIATAAMLLRGLSKPNDPHERAIPRNLQALVETAAVQQAECSISRHRLTTSLPIRGTRTQ